MDETAQPMIVPNEMTWYRRRPLIGGDTVRLTPGTTYALRGRLNGTAGLRMVATDSSVLVAFSRRHASEEWVEATFSVQSPTDAIIEWATRAGHGSVDDPTLERR
jgi:hypothetical protein